MEAFHRGLAHIVSTVEENGLAHRGRVDMVAHDAFLFAHVQKLKKRRRKIV